MCRVLSLIIHHSTGTIRLWFRRKSPSEIRPMRSNIVSFIWFLQESLRKQQKRAEERRRRQHRESLEAQGIDSAKQMYHQKQREEIKQKQAYVLSSPLSHMSSTPTRCSSGVCGCFLSQCADGIHDERRWFLPFFSSLREFEERQKSKRGEIAAKLLQEERLLKSRKRQRQALLAKHSTGVKFPALERARETLLRYLDPSSPPPPPAAEERATAVRSSKRPRWQSVNRVWVHWNTCVCVCVCCSAVETAQWPQPLVVSLLWRWGPGGGNRGAGSGPPEPRRQPGGAWVLWAVGPERQGALQPAAADKIQAKSSQAVLNKQRHKSCPMHSRHASFICSSFPVVNNSAERRVF